MQETGNGPQLSDDLRFWWDGKRWQPVPQLEQVPRESSSLVGKIVVSIVVAFVLIVGSVWLIHGVATANAPLQCAIDNSQRAGNGQPQHAC